jgi:hypothetical protein
MLHNGPERTPTVTEVMRFYFASAGRVVKVWAAGMRIPKMPIWQPGGVSNSMVLQITIDYP